MRVLDIEWVCTGNKANGDKCVSASDDAEKAIAACQYVPETEADDHRFISQRS
ncbi:hypothetical protein M378DRAFT_163647 [Amanita muscaria Koide BX008]|uniref:Uncharacterized protein n=1 Tax=Amanita muscaria (strain Koide BX008) TaxID=946122 RepID=A0A0C2X4G8_AMAMK|nr:hypothetical protein M378DRAFT_163647 [Amanita muscaria Koide BX008]